MLVMCADNSNAMFHYLCGRVPGRLGWLVGPTYHKFKPWVPYACDNDRYSAFTRGHDWSETKWKRFVEKCANKEYKPLWYLVPDSVGNRDETLRMWDKYAMFAIEHGPIAFAVQDGMVPKDVPACDVVFVGGTTQWKWRTVDIWAKSFKRVHVGRVASIDRLKICESLGVESTDSTGWFKDGNESKKAHWLMQYLLGQNKFETLL